MPWANETSLSRRMGAKVPEGGMHMKIGFIGAGKAGFSLGKYLTERGVHVTGYYSRSPQSSQEAAEFTGTGQYRDLGSLADDSDVLFLAVPDGAIASVWDEVRQLPIQNKKIIHCSGSVSSAVFCGIDAIPAFGYSVHPLLAFHDRTTSWRELHQAVFTIEGSAEHLEEVRALFTRCGNHVEVIASEEKTRYHAAAVMASNLMVGLAAVSERMLCDCGFSPESAHAALAPLIVENAQNIAACGPREALTGPVERDDIGTVRAHRNVLSGREEEIYRLLSEELVTLARERHPDRDYTPLEEELL